MKSRKENFKDSQMKELSYKKNKCKNNYELKKLKRQD
jgi:hypothetical protein